MIFLFRPNSFQLAEAESFSGPVNVLDAGVELYLVYIGREEVSGGGSIEVYIDNYDDFLYNRATRTTYNNIGAARIMTGSYPCDIYQDGKVNLKDIAQIGAGRPTIYGLDTLDEAAANRLFST